MPFDFVFCVLSFESKTNENTSQDTLTEVILAEILGVSVKFSTTFQTLTRR